MSKSFRNEEKRQWAVEKPKLDNACRLRGVYHVDPDDMEFENTKKFARRMLEIPLESPMISKALSVARHRETCCGNSDNQISRDTRVVKAHESGRMRKKETQQDHQDHIAEKGFNSLSHYYLVHKPSPLLQAVKILDAKAAVDKEWEKLEKLAVWQLTNVKAKKRPFWKHKKRRGKSTLVR